MVAFFVIGLLYISGSWLEKHWLQIPVIFFDCYCLVQSIYLLNSYFGADSDKHNHRFRNRTIDDEKTASRYLAWSAAFLFVSVLINAWFQWKGVALILANYILWACYASPKVNLKGHYMFGTGVHFVSGIINFHIGYLTYGNFGEDSLMISIYFSLLFSAGHLHHMVLDYEADFKAGIRTLAVALGLDKTMNLSIIVVGVSGIYYIVMGKIGIVGSVTVLSVAAATLIHFILFFIYRPAMKGVIGRIRYRNSYRVLHAINLVFIALVNFGNGTL